MKRFLTHTSLQVALPLFSCWIIFLVADPEHVFNHSLEKELARIVNEHGQVSGVCNINDRAFKQRLITESLEQNGKLMVFLGSSRIMTIDSLAIDSTSYLNLGLAGASYLDLMGCYTLLKDARAIEGNHFVVGLDPWMFTLNQQSNHFRWTTFLPSLYKHGFLSRLERIKAEGRRYTRLLSSWAFKAWIGNKGACQPQIKRDIEKNTYTHSGCLIYPEKLTQRTSSEVQKEIDKYILQGVYKLSQEEGLAGFAQKIRDFASWEAEIQALGGEVTFIFNPYPTAVYHHIHHSIPFFKEAEIKIQENLGAVGSWVFNDSTLHDTDAFMDGSHLQPETANCYYRSFLSSACEAHETEHERAKTDEREHP